LTGYQVSNTVNVTVRQIANASAVLDAAVRAGANVAQGISFELDTPRQTQAREDALRRAVADARRKAQVIAEAAGVGPITLIAISENGAPPIRPVFREAFAARGGAADVATPVQPGENTVTATVTIRYRFAPTTARAAAP
jgi:uncharacterized protein YggE